MQIYLKMCSKSVSKTPRAKEARNLDFDDSMMVFNGFLGLRGTKILCASAHSADRSGAWSLGLGRLLPLCSHMLLFTGFWDPGER